MPITKKTYKIGKLQQLIDLNQDSTNFKAEFKVAAKDQDKIVNVKQSEELFEKLREHNLTSVFLELPWANHIFDIIMYGPGGQLVYDYLTQFLVWTLSMKKKEDEVKR